MSGPDGNRPAARRSGNPLWRAARVAWRGLLALVHLLVGVLLTPFVTRRDAAGHWHVDRRIARWWHGRLLRILHVRLMTTGTPPAAPALVVSNHISWVDIHVLGYLLPTVFLSKAEVLGWPLIGWLAKRSGTLFIRRGSGQATQIRQTIADYLRRGGMVTLFPEGTTSDGLQVLRFLPPLFGAAIEAEAPVAPVALRYTVDGRPDLTIPYTGQQTLLENLAGLLGRRGSEVHVWFGEPIPSLGTERKALAEAARAQIVTAIFRRE
ncbi:MAG: 1-acyl-sn-glycerol-3-phosphate acyltransferase [Gammaproteobacteria bacterium]|nr:MAG: 1-acyl-sn-glycerol-3-phosphate acyltransferase [Gammaproteobacteria bacterium]